MKRILKNIGKTFLFHCLFPLLYRWYSVKPVEQKTVLFLEIRYAELTDNFTLLYEAFSGREGFSIDTCFLGNSVCSYGEYTKRCFGMLKKLAGAEYVFVNESSNALAALKIRKETKLIQTWHGCGAFKRFGHAGQMELKENYYNPYTFVTVSSPAVVDIYAQSMRQDRQHVLPIGVSRTDVYFRTEFLKECAKQIKSRYPGTAGRNIILYAPTFRGNVQKAESPRLLDIRKMYEGLGQQYVILYKGHPAVKNRVAVPEEYADFFYDASGEQIETLLSAADLCITDYSSLIFEYALLGRPMYFYAYDYKEYVTERGFYYNYEQFVPGPICFTEESLIKEITKTDRSLLLQQVQGFRKRFMSACDGNSTNRIIEQALQV